MFRGSGRVYIELQEEQLYEHDEHAAAAGHIYLYTRRALRTRKVSWNGEGMGCEGRDGKRRRSRSRTNGHTTGSKTIASAWAL